jgi:predicted phage tail protein
MKHIQLHGVLADKFGEHWDLDVRTPVEGLRAIAVNCPGFLPHLIESDKQGIAYRVVLGDRDISLDALASPTGKEVIHLVPVMAGAKSGFGQILLGAALVGVAIMTGGAGGALSGQLFTLAGQSVTWASIAFSIGSSLILGGVAQMLAPSPKTPAAAEVVEDRPSYYFNGPTNRMQQGNAVPVGYGQLIVGAMPISAGISTEAIANVEPTLTAFASTVDSVAAETRVEITLADLMAQGDEADVDGSVVAFIVKAVSTGTLEIGSSFFTANSWAAGGNDRIDSVKKAYWTSDPAASGTVNAFTVVAVDNVGAESATPIQVTVQVTP